MKKSEIFEKVLSVVSEQMELSSERILSTGRTEEEVDARCLFVYSCKKMGLSNEYLKNVMKRKSTNCIQHLYNNYAIRKEVNRFFAHNASIIEKQLTYNE